MAQVKYIVSFDMGRSNMHAAVYAYDSAKKTLTKVKDYNDTKNDEFEQQRDGLLTERVDKMYGAAEQAIANLPQEIKANLGAVVFDAHGAAGTIVDAKGNPLFTQIYDHDASKLRKLFHRICGNQEDVYLETSTPALDKGINYGMQLVYLLARHGSDMREYADRITSLAGYVPEKLFGTKVFTDITHAANHGYAVNWKTGRLSDSMRKLGKRYEFDIGRLFRGIRREPYRAIGVVGKNRFGLAEDCKIYSISHDTSLAAELARAAGFESLDSSGTWSVLVGLGKKFNLESWMENLGLTFNRDALGNILPSVMFRGGQMWKKRMERAGQNVGYNPQFDIGILTDILEKDVFVLPSDMDNTGPYRHGKKAAPVPRGLNQDPVKLAHAVQLANALLTMYAQATSLGQVNRRDTLPDVIENYGADLLVAGPLREGLAANIIGQVNQYATHVTTDPTHVSLAGAIVGAAGIEGVRPDELELKRSSLGIRNVTPKDRVSLDLLLRYAGRYDRAARRAAEKVEI